MSVVSLRRLSESKPHGQFPTALTRTLGVTPRRRQVGWRPRKTQRKELIVRSHDLWIDGAAALSDAGNRIERCSPSTGKLLASFTLGSCGDVDTAVMAARRSFEAATWRGLPGSERAKAMNKWAELLQRNCEALSLIEADEVGKPIAASRAEIEYGIDLVRYAASLAWSIQGRILSDEGADKLGIILHEPRGVVGIITPWNYPVVCLMMKLPYALAAGCSVVVKPSEFTSGTTLEIARLASESGIPEGVFNVVTGTGAEVGEAISGHPGVDMVSFTGSSAVGKRIAQRASDTTKRVSLELGGKSANIVFADADIDEALEGTLQAFTINQGEECCAGSRLLIERSIADEFLTRLAERASKIRVGDPRDPATEMGPLIHEAHLERVLGYIEKGKAEGAKTIAGGRRLSGTPYDKGFFVPPTIFTGVTTNMSIFKEEIFGPVVSAVAFDSLDEAVDIANSTTYGLAGGVWTQNFDKALSVVRRVRTGMMYINCYLQTIAQLPFGGMKESGFGRENGIEGLMEFLEVRAAFAKLKTQF